MFKKLLVDKIVEWNLDSNEISKSFKNEYRKNISNQLDDCNNYLSFEICNGKINKLVFATFSNTPVELDRIDVQCFFFTDENMTKGLVRIELVSLRNFFRPKKIKLVIRIRPEHKKLQALVRKFGLVVRGVKLRASVKESFAAITKMKLPQLSEDYSFRLMNYNKDIDQIMLMEARAHRNEPSSVIHNLPRKELAFFRTILKELCKTKTAFVFCYRERPIGLIAHSISKKLKGNSMISTISLDPKFKGQGLSKYLYSKLIHDLEKRNIKTYYGYSSTNQVLDLATSIKRYPILYSFIIDSKSLEKIDYI